MWRRPGRPPYARLIRVRPLATPCAPCFRAASTRRSVRPQAGGCLLVLGVVNCQPDTEPLRDLLIRIRADTEAAIRARLDRGVLEGDLSPSADTQVLANYFSMLMQGLSMQARDGASRGALEALIAPSLAALTDALPPR